MLWGMCTELDCDSAEEVVEDGPVVRTAGAPIVQKLPNGLCFGETIVVKAKRHSSPFQFAVNFITNDKVDCDILFHFNPRYDRRIVVRNHRRRSSWGEEEICAESPFPFPRDRGFWLTFFVADGKIMVAVNGRHFCSFSFRFPADDVRFIEFVGDLNLSKVNFQTSTFYPPTIFKTPSLRMILPLTDVSHPASSIKTKRKNDFIAPGSIVVIEGRVRLLPQCFYVNLQTGWTITPHPIIPLHINLRLCQPGLLEQQMIINSWIGGGWGEEIKPDVSPFSPGKVFQLKIFYYEDGFSVFVNEQFLVSFPLRLPYPPILDTVFIQGDVIISKVKISRCVKESVQ